MRFLAASKEDATWLYPLQGIAFFATHPYFYPLFRSRLLPVLFISLFIYTILFTFAYLPQVAFLAIFHGHAAWVSAVFLVLGEGAALVALLFEAFFVDETLVDVFDAVLITRGEEDLVAPYRTLEAANFQGLDGCTVTRNPVQRLGQPLLAAVYSPFSFRQIIEFVIFLPINLVPVVGPIFFLFLTGYRAGPLAHHRYFSFLNFTKKERKAYVKQRRLRYTLFGTMALALQLVPMVSMFFLLTSAAGSALWASDMERAKRRIAHQTAPSTGPQYRDEPV